MILNLLCRKFNYSTMARADPGFLYCGFKFARGGGGGVDLLILPDFSLIFPVFFFPKILHENEIFVLKGVSSATPLDPSLYGYLTDCRITG